MAIQDAELKAMVEVIKSYPQEYQDIAAMAYRIGHEDGWWLARTDPNSTVSPYEQEVKDNPFNNGVPKVTVEPYEDIDYSEPLPYSGLQESPEEARSGTIRSAKQWGVEYKGTVSQYKSEEEARKQHLMASWDVPAVLVSSVDDGKTWTAEAPGGYLP